MPKKQVLCERAERAKRLLLRPAEMEAELEMLQGRVQRLREKVDEIGAAGKHLDPLDSRIIRLMDAEDRVARMLAELAVLRGRVNAALTLLPAQEALLLRLRLLRGLDWEGVALHLYMCERTARRHFEPALVHFAEAYEEGQTPLRPLERRRR